MGSWKVLTKKSRIKKGWYLTTVVDSPSENLKLLFWDNKNWLDENNNLFSSDDVVAFMNLPKAFSHKCKFYKTIEQMNYVYDVDTGEPVSTYYEYVGVCTALDNEEVCCLGNKSMCVLNDNGI